MSELPPDPYTEDHDRETLIQEFAQGLVKYLHQRICYYDRTQKWAPEMVESVRNNIPDIVVGMETSFKKDLPPKTGNKISRADMVHAVDEWLTSFRSDHNPEHPLYRDIRIYHYDWWVKGMPED